MVKKSYIMKDIESNRRLTVVEEKPTYARCEVEPLMRGFGLTLGHAVRRMLLSSIVGAAATTVRIHGVKHEFSTLRGMEEDVMGLLMNLKQLAFKMDGEELEKVTLDETGPKTVTAGDLKLKKGLTVVNPDLVLAHLSEDGHLRMELDVELGRGYRPIELKEQGQEIGRIAIDAAFSPVRKVNYSVASTRVGQQTDFDKLILEVWTNGAIKPMDAVAFAAKLIKEHMQVFINFEEVDDEVTHTAGLTVEEQQLLDQLEVTVDEIELSVRSSNCLRGANIGTLGELITLSEPELLKTRNFGSKSLQEIKEKLQERGLRLGMREEIESIQARAAAAKR